VTEALIAVLHFHTQNYGITAIKHLNFDAYYLCTINTSSFW